jgi:hypothetical protein
MKCSGWQAAGATRIVVKSAMRDQGARAWRRCPGCSQEMSSADLREHRLPCVRDELNKLRGMTIQLTPKDPDPYPNFRINFIRDGEVEFQKGSNHDVVTVDLRKIAEITINTADRVANVRVLGRIVWRAEIKRWRFAPTGTVGRPPKQL